MVRRCEDSFRYMRKLFNIWLEGARYRDILRLLYLIREELSRRAYTLSYAIHREHPKKAPGGERSRELSGAGSTPPFMNGREER